MPDVSLRKLLPQASMLFQSQPRRNWNANGNVNNFEFLKACILEVIRIQESCLEAGDIRALKIFSKTAISDLIDVKSLKRFDDCIDALNLFQFSVTMTPLSYLANIKNLQEGYDWIAFGLCDDLSDSQKKEIEYNRPFGFTQDLIVSLSVDRWIGDFYYICRSLNAMPIIARELFDWSQDVSLLSLQEGRIGEFLWSFSGLACWGANNNDERTSKVVAKMEQLINDEETANTVVHGLLLCLSTAVCEYSSKPSCEWAQQALEKYSKLSKGHENLHLLLESCPNGVAISDEKLRQICAEIAKCQPLYSSSVESLQAQDRLSGILSPFIGKCLDMKQGADAVRVLKAWYNITTNQAVNDDSLLIIYPNSRESLIYSVGGQSFILPRNIEGAFSNMVSISNRFLGISSSVGRNPDFELNEPDPDRFGVPSDEVSQEMESSLTNFYATNDVKSFLDVNSMNISSMVSLPSNHHAIQYLLQKHTGHCWPIASSLLAPAEDREVRKVCMWCGAGSITEEMELNAVRSVLEHSGIQVDQYSSKETTKAQFIGIYESIEYDVIWVMSHGEFDHWQPGNVSIVVGTDGDLSLDEMLQLDVPEKDGRRLLLLNVCDGATYSNQGGIPRLGIAPSVAGSNQCAISHLWPVSPFAAAAFGFLYASSISKGLGFFEAYQDALNRIGGTQNDVLNEIERACLDGGEFVQRLSSRELPFELMAHSGSAAFFQ